MKRSLIIGLISIAAVAGIVWAAAGQPEPAVGLYWVFTCDPTTAPCGANAPLYQLGIRTDSPSIWYHATASPTGWVSLSGGGGGGTVTSIACDAGTSCTPDPITSSGTITVNQQLNVPNGQVFVTTGGTLNNWDPWSIAGVGRTTYVEIDPNTASVTITGLAAGNDGDYVTLWNGGNGGSAGVDGGTGLPDTVTLVNQSGSSLAANRFWIADGKMVNIANNDGVTLRYDAAFGWVCFSCSQSLPRAQELSVDPAATPTALSGGSTYNDYTPWSAGTTSNVQQAATGGGTATITGIAAAGAPNSQGRIVIWQNTSTTTTQTLVNESGASNPANQILTPSGQDIVISAPGSAVLIYDDSVAMWRVVDYTAANNQTISTTIATNEPNWSPTGFSSAVSTIVLTSAGAGLTIQGLSSTGFISGQHVTIANYGGVTVSFTNQDGASSAANQFYTQGAITRTIGNYGAITFTWVSGKGWVEDSESSFFIPDANFTQIAINSAQIVSETITAYWISNTPLTSFSCNGTGAATCATSTCTNVSGTLTTNTSATTCSIVFSSGGYGHAPSCTASASTGFAYISARAPTGVTFTFPTATAGTLDYVCNGH